MHQLTVKSSICGTSRHRVRDVDLADYDVEIDAVAGEVLKFKRDD